MRVEPENDGQLQEMRKNHGQTPPPPPTSPDSPLMLKVTFLLTDLIISSPPLIMEKLCRPLSHTHLTMITGVVAKPLKEV